MRIWRGEQARDHVWCWAWAALAVSGLRMRRTWKKLPRPCHGSCQVSSCKHRLPVGPGEQDWVYCQATRRRGHGRCCNGRKLASALLARGTFTQHSGCRSASTPVQHRSAARGHLEHHQAKGVDIRRRRLLGTQQDLRRQPGRVGGATHGDRGACLWRQQLAQVEICGKQAGAFEAGNQRSRGRGRCARAPEASNGATVVAARPCACIAMRNVAQPEGPSPPHPRP